MTTARTLRRDAAENRERLLTAASQIFALHGPDACVEDIARAAGVGMGTLYRRFPTKQDLIDELVGGLREQMAVAAQQALGEPDDVCLDRVLQVAAELVFTGRGYSNRLWFSTAAGDEHVQAFRDALATALGRAQAAGVARSELVPADLYAIMWSVRGIVDQTHAVAPDAWRRHLEIVLAGLRPGAGLTRPPITAAQLAGIQAEQKASSQTSMTIGNSMGRRR